MKKFTAEQINKILEASETNTAKQIAENFNMKTNTVYVILKRNNKRAVRPEPVAHPLVDQIISSYLKGETYKEMQAKYHVTSRTIAKTMWKYKAKEAEESKIYEMRRDNSDFIRTLENIAIKARAGKSSEEVADSIETALKRFVGLSR